MDKSTSVSSTLVNLWAHLPGNFWVINKALKLVAISDGYLALINEKQADVIGKNIVDIYQDKPYARLLGGVHSLGYSLKKVSATGKEERITVKLEGEQAERPDEQRTFELLYRPILDKSNQVEYIIQEVQEVAPTETALHKTKEHQGFLLKLSDRIRDLKEEEEIGSTCARLLAEEMGLNRVYFGSFYPEREQVRIGPEYHSPSLPPVGGWYDYSDFPEAIREQESEMPIYEDTANDPRLPETEKRRLLALGFGAWICVPIRAKKKKIDWALYVVFSSSHKWSANEVALVEEVADKTWAAFERAHAEEALRKSEQKYRRLFETMGQGFVQVELIRNASGQAIDQRYLEMNPAFERLLGVPVSEASGRLASEVFPGIDPWWTQTFDRILRAGKPDRIDHLFNVISRWFEVYVYPMTVDRLIVLYEDITERKRTEEELRHNEEKLERKNKVFEGVNRIFAKAMTAHTEEELSRFCLSVAEDVTDSTFSFMGEIKPETGGLDDLVISDRGWETFAAKDRRWFEEKVPIAFEIHDLYDQVLTSGKSLFTNDLPSHPDSPKGQPSLKAFLGIPLKQKDETVGMFGLGNRKGGYWQEQLEDAEALAPVIMQVLLNKRIDDSLRKSQEHLQLIMESAKGYAIITLDQDRIVTDWNIGAERLLGYTKQEIIGQCGDIIFNQEDRENKVPEQEMEHASGKGRAENERWHIRKDGSRFWGSGLSMPLRNGDGMLRGFLKIMRDNTEKMQTEESLKQAKAAAEQAARAKEEFLAHMSHEIRTPLNAIVGISNLLLQRKPRTDQVANLQTLKFSSDNLMNLINDILDFSKIEAGKVTFEETEFDLHILLDSLEQAHQLRAHEKNIRLQLNITEQVPHTVKGDQLKLSQILHNLLSNAIKFTHQGTVALEISLHKKEEEHIWLDFSISDTGIGISKEKQALIFEKFTQADISTVRQYGGTGLGLAITRALLELMGSSIQVESDLGRGTRFFFSLQLKAVVPANDASATELSPADAVDLEGMTILLAEDVDINRMLVSQFLQDWWNLTPDEASNGQEAVEKAQQHEYDLILMDIRMPIMDGYEAARLIRDLPGEKHKKVPIIALTADTRQDFRKDPKASYFNDIIIKPFDPGDLQQKIIRYAPQDKTRLAPPGPAALHYDKIENFLRGNKSGIITFYTQACTQISEYKQVFREAMTNKDLKKLSDLQHKATVLFDMLALERLKSLLKKNNMLIKENASPNITKQAIEEGETLFDEAITAIKKRNDELKEEGS